MKALVYRKFGGPDVLQIDEIAEPVPTADQIVIDVKTTSINVIDYRAQ